MSSKIDDRGLYFVGFGLFSRIIPEMTKALKRFNTHSRVIDFYMHTLLIVATSSFDHTA